MKKIPVSTLDQVQKDPRCFALGSGRVHAIRFLPGAWIPAHDPLVILESEGVFIPHALPRNSRVKEWKIEANEWVALGQELAIVEIVSEKSDMPE